MTAIETASQPTNDSSARIVLGAILLGFGLRLALAGSLGLGVDESYMVAAGRVLRLGYFDHPPLSWWLSASAARLAGSETPWVVRLPFMVLFAGSTWLMFRLGTALFGPRAGMWASVALNLAPVFSIAAGGWVLPDGPLDFCLLAAALCLVRALTGGAWRWWLAAGVAAGLALLSKYSAGLVLAGALFYLLTQPTHRAWLRRPQPYAAALLCLAVFSPVLLWNANHGWASFAFQGSRANAEHFLPFGPLGVFGGEALFLLPWLWLPLMFVLVRGFRAGPSHWRQWLASCLAVGPILLFALVGFWSKHVLFHWAAPGYLMLFPPLGADLERLVARRPKLIRRTLIGTLALYGVAIVVLVAEFRFDVADRLFPLARAEMQARDWTNLRTALAERGLLVPGLLIGGVGWQETGKLDFAMGGAAPVICLNADAREYGFAPGMADHIGADILIASAKPIVAAALAREGVRFDALQPLDPVDVMPGGTLFLTLGHRLHRP
jgi:4-amino-4-deoxy-L-arabinose transferase-like glycosyltransferase